MRPADLWSLEQAGQCTISPDGRWIAYVVTRYVGDRRLLEREIQVVACDGTVGPTRISPLPLATTPVWSPGSDWLAFLAPDARAYQVHRVRVDAAALAADVVPASQQLTQLAVSAAALRWPNDRIYFMCRRSPPVADVAIAFESPLVGYWTNLDWPARDLRIFELDPEAWNHPLRDLLGAAQPLFEYMQYGVGGAWDVSPDGRYVVFSANTPIPPAADDLYATPKKINFNLHLLSVADQAITPLTEGNPFDDFHPRFSRDGRYVVYGAKQSSTLQADYPRVMVIDGGPGLDFVKRPPVAVTGGGRDEPDMEYPLDWVFLEPDCILVTIESAGRVAVRRARLGAPPGTRTQALPCASAGALGGGSVAEFTAAGPARAPLAASVQSSLESPPEIYLYDGGEQRSRAMTALNGDRMARLAPIEVEDLRFAGHGDTQVQMLVVLPPGFRDDERCFPVLHLIHGGPHSPWRDRFNFRFNARVLASQGYVVTAVNFHGSVGHQMGEIFAGSVLPGDDGPDEATFNDWATRPMEDMERAHRAVLERYGPSVDPERVGLVGGSYGGYLGARLLGTWGARLKVGVLHAGVYDLMHFAGATDGFWVQKENFGALPWEDWAPYEALTLRRPDLKFTTPTLLTHGVQDLRVPWTSSLMLHRQMQALEAESRLVLFHSEGHWIERPDASLRWWDEVLGWLDKHLRPR